MEHTASKFFISFRFKFRFFVYFAYIVAMSR